jgi:hypothetical protein
LCDWSFHVLGEIFIDEGIRSSKSLSLGMPKAPQDNILRRLKHLSLGMPRVGIPSLFHQPSVFYLKLYFYSSHDMCFAWSILYDMSLCFLFWVKYPCYTHLFERAKIKLWFVRMAHMLHLNFLRYGIALVLHLYLFEHGVLYHFWRNALMLHLDLFGS